MSKRSHRRMKTNRQGNVLIIPDKRDLVQEQEILAKPSDSFYGTIVERMMDRLHAQDCTALEAQNIGLALQQLLRGDAALLNNMDDPAVAEQVAKLREQAAAADRANEKWETDQERFIDEVYTRADKIMPVGDKKTRVIANGMAELQQARVNAKARQAAQQLEFEHRLAHDPKVLVNVQAEFENRTINGVVGMVEIKPVLKILGRTFVLTPGQQMLPKILAERYEAHQRTLQENEARRTVMKGNLERAEYEQRMAQIDRDFGNPRNGQNMTA